MDLGDLFDICDAYDSLGWAVQAQLKEFADDDTAEVNPNAMRLAQERFVQPAIRRVSEMCEDDELVSELEALDQSITRLLTGGGEEEDDFEDDRRGAAHLHQLHREEDSDE